MPTIIPARHGAHVLLQKGQQIRVINPSGHQVVDTWAFPLTDVPTWLSMAQTRQKLGRLRPISNDIFVDTHRKPLLTLIEDTSSRVHDMVYPACDDWRYAEAGEEGHDSCAGNLRRELAATVESAAEIKHLDTLREVEKMIRLWKWTPEPLNLFMNVAVGSVHDGGLGSLEVGRPNCKEGDYVVLRTEVDCLFVMSSCPNDLLDTNGGEPRDSAYEILV
ncbi:hypothetical protein K491DRAFT_695146 [Lophiostoma macrostomum CBS 122681]|uniref:DUF1989 domain-containing protein n=1 Tax=Lophiostoma macrostomum CBS 122681 TaxID=1314788 RepID=A0A6A6SZU3_9PLEO|nr:hypothetical protein K491DRAFT_695146 [Lophiostoma macrostomum CBS 122681]